MRTLSRLMIAAGVLGTIAGTGATPTLAQGVYFEGPGFGVGVGRPATGSAITGATTIMIVRASTRKGDITEVPRCTSVIRTDGVTGTGIRRT
jgi:hypothetical protein